MRNLIAWLLRVLVNALMPFLLVAAGAGIASLGLTYSLTLLIWTGLIMVGAGILWGLFLFLYYTEGGASF